MPDTLTFKFHDDGHFKLHFPPSFAAGFRAFLNYWETARDPFLWEPQDGHPKEEVSSLPTSAMRICKKKRHLLSSLHILPPVCQKVVRNKRTLQGFLWRCVSGSFVENYSYNPVLIGIE